MSVVLCLLFERISSVCAFPRFWAVVCENSTCNCKFTYIGTQLENFKGKGCVVEMGHKDSAKQLAQVQSLIAVRMANS